MGVSCYCGWERREVWTSERGELGPWLLIPTSFSWDSSLRPVRLRRYACQYKLASERAAGIRLGPFRVARGANPWICVCMCKGCCLPWCTQAHN
ncbi:unnamed protein product [Phytomonas sp. EM1]|nr:unnamed protein product [Phytomonas sp. EM1]|eukprot:CCW60313.1 unnamed protein product [Phytomonas sp. isolate EM1]